MSVSYRKGHLQRLLLSLNKEWKNIETISKMSFTSFFVMMLMLTLVSMMYLGYFDFNHDSFTLFVKVMPNRFSFGHGFHDLFGSLGFKPRNVNKSLYISIPVVIVFLSFPLLFAVVWLFWFDFHDYDCGGIGIIASAAVLCSFTLNSTERLVSSFFWSFIVIYFVFERACSLVHPYLGSFVLPF